MMQQLISTDWGRQEAQEKAELLLTRYPDTTVVWTASDPSGVAAVELRLSHDGGASFPTVVAAGLANTGLEERRKS